MYVAKVYNTRKKESFFRPYITEISRMLLLISARMLNVCSAHFLSRIMPHWEGWIFAALPLQKREIRTISYFFSKMGSLFTFVQSCAKKTNILHNYGGKTYDI